MAEGDSSHAIRNAVVAGVLVALVAPVFEPVRNAIGAAASWLWRLVERVAGFLTSSHAIPGWLLLALVVLAAFTVGAWLHALSRRLRGNTSAAYRSEELFGARWRWSASGGAIAGLWCFCPVCDTELVSREQVSRGAWLGPHDPPDATAFLCEHCGGPPLASFSGRLEDALGTVRREIDRRIRSGEWRPASAKQP